LPDLTGDTVEHDIHAATVGQRADLYSDILPAVVDAVIRA
jgi:hypothetical protein